MSTDIQFWTPQCTTPLHHSEHEIFRQYSRKYVFAFSLFSVPTVEYCGGLTDVVTFSHNVYLGPVPPCSVLELVRLIIIDRRGSSLR